MTIQADTLPVLPFYHADMPDEPNTIFPSSLQLKQAFDSSTIAIQTVYNQLIADLLSAVAGASAAESLGSAPVTGLSTLTVWAQINEIEQQIISLVGGVVPPGTITTAMLQNLSVTTAKLANNAVTFQKLSTDMETAALGGQDYAYRNFKGAL